MRERVLHVGISGSTGNTVTVVIIDEASARLSSGPLG